MFLEICFFLWSCPIFGIVFSYEFLYFCGISCYLSFISCIIWIVFSLLSLAIDVSIFISENQFLVILIFCIFGLLFLLSSLFPALCWLWACFGLLLIHLGGSLVCSWYYFLFVFLRKACIAMKFLLITNLLHLIDFIMFSFSCVSRYFMISLITDLFFFFFL